MTARELIPERVGTAYRCSGGSLGWEALRGMARAMAGYLVEDGSSPVLLCGHKEPMMPVCTAACLLAGRAYIPCDDCLPDERIAYMAQLAGAGLALCPGGRELTFIKCLGGRDLLRAAEENTRLSSSLFLTGSPDRPAYIIFTSGSSGQPKGVEISTGNLRCFSEWFAALPAIAELAPRRVLNMARFSFDLSVAELCHCLRCGAELFALSSEELADPAAMLPRMAESGAELAVMTPSMAEYCLTVPDFGRNVLPRLGAVFFCGEPLRVRTVGRLFERFPGLRIINAYGPTEAACAVCASEITPDMLSLPKLPCGDISSAAVDIAIENGEITLRGGSVGRYIGGLRGGFFEEDGARGYRTGDLGRIEDGRLYCDGRLDRQIKYSGYRIEPEEIENALLGLPGVAAAAVFPRRDSHGRVSGLAAVCSSQLTPEEIKTALAALLPRYMLPKTVEAAEALPMTPNGKLDRERTAKLYALEL